MLRVLRVLLVANLALIATACGGGGANSLSGQTVPPVTDAAGKRVAESVESLVIPPRYIAIKLPAGFIPQAMMPNGRIPGSIGRNAALYLWGRLQILGTFGSEYAVATSANSFGEAVGFSQTGPLGSVEVAGRALLFSNGSVKQLAGLPGTDFSDARAISNHGDIYGGSGSKDNLGGPRTLQLVRFSQSGPAVATTPALFFNDESADRTIAINTLSAYTVTRAGDGSAAFPNRAYLGSGLTIQPVVTTNETTADDLNDLGQVVGHWDRVGCQVCSSSGFVHDATGLHFLPFNPTGINDSGTMIGNDFNGGAVVYLHGVKYPLNNVLTNAHLSGTTTLNGMSNRGGFIVTTNFTAYYVIVPADPDHDGDSD